MLSIIIPVYNAEPYLKACLDSIEGNSCADWECILVDDGSTDNSPSICNLYSAKDNRFKVSHITNGGPSKARNVGLDIAQGEYISFIDSDDWVDENYVDLALSSITDADVLFFGLKKVAPNGKIQVCAPQSGFASNQVSIELLLNSLLVNTERCAYFGFSVNKVFKRQIIDFSSIRFNENIRIREDELFTIRYCANIQSCKVIHAAPYNYRIINDSLSHSLKTFANYATIAREVISASHWIVERNLRQSMNQKIMTYCQNAVMEAIKDNQNINAAIDEFLLTNIRNPCYRKVSPKWLKFISLLPGDFIRRKFIRMYLVIYIKRCK
jgi:glycosyltransferase involved in cell wall biosynthesis